MAMAGLTCKAASPMPLALVANYFVAFGWKPGMPTHYPLVSDATWLDMDALMAPTSRPPSARLPAEAKGAVLTEEAAPTPARWP